MSAAPSYPPAPPRRRDSDTVVTRMVRCPACVHPCVRPDELDDDCAECGGLRMVPQPDADAWLLRNMVPA